jgi:hypothetical protein
MNLRARYQILLLVTIVLGVYYPTLFAPLNSLDDQLYVHNLLNQGQFSLEKIFLPGGGENYYRPLLALSFQFDKYVGGLEESNMHLFNILLHVLNAVLIFLLTRSLMAFTSCRSHILPFLASLWFALHPVNTEAVNWIMGRTDLLAGTFVYTSLLVLLRALQKQSLMMSGVAASLFFAGTLCKETALFMFAGVALILFWKTKVHVQNLRTRVATLGFYSLAVVIYFALRNVAFSYDRGMDHTAKFAAKALNTPFIENSSPHVASGSLWDLLQVFLAVCGFYLKKLIQPLPLNYAIMDVHAEYLYLGILLVLVLAFLLWRRGPVGTFILLSAGIASSALFVIFSQLAWAPVAERYMYIPCGTFVAAMSIGLYTVVERFRLQNLAAISACLLLFAAGWATAQRNIIWQDNLTLYQDTVKKSPGSALARNELALALLAKGRTDDAESIIQSIGVPQNQRSSLNKAAILADQGEYQAARDFLLDRLEKPGKLESRILEMLIKITHEMIDETDDENLKTIYFEETLVWLNRLDEMSGDPFINYRIGRVQMWLNNITEAQKNFAIAARLLPDESPYKAAANKLALKLAK